MQLQKMVWMPCSRACGLAQPDWGDFFVPVGDIAPQQCTQCSPLVCGALQREDAPLGHLEVFWH